MMIQDDTSKKDEFATPEICIQSISRSLSRDSCRHYNDSGHIFDSIPKNFLTSDFFTKLLDAAPNVFQYLPKTEDICHLAILKDGELLYKVPEKIKTLKLCKIAVSNYGLALEYVPEHLKTIDICIAAVQNCNRALSFVPPEIIEQVLEGVREIEEK